MANWYVWNGATGGGTGADWANAYTRLNTALTAKAAGDTFFVADDHVETAATAQTYVSPGTDANPCFIYCVRRTGGSVPPVAADLRTTAQINTTVASSISLQGLVYECYGMNFSAGSSTSVANINVGSTLRTWHLHSCTLRLNGSAATSRINLGVQGAYTVLENTTVSFGGTSQAIAPGGRVSIRMNGAAFTTGATLPGTLFIHGTLVGHTFIEGVDFSNHGSGKNLIDHTTTVTATVVLKDCKLGVGVIATLPPPSPGALETHMIRCDAGDKNYISEKRTSIGRQVINTSIVRTGGATDGTTPVSWEFIIGGTNSTKGMPLEAPPISIWNETIGSAITVTIEGTWSGSGVNPANNDIWIDVEYLGTSGFPLGSRVSSGTTTLQTPTTYPSSSATWSGAAADRFYMSVSVTPQEKGPITIYLFGRRPTLTTYYIDPKPVIT